jgi:hypothetical protein
MKAFRRAPDASRPLVVGVPLSMDKQIVQAVWSGVRGSTVHLDSPATLSVIYS